MGRERLQRPLRLPRLLGGQVSVCGGCLLRRRCLLRLLPVAREVPMTRRGLGFIPPLIMTLPGKSLRISTVLPLTSAR